MILHIKYQGSRPCGFRQEVFSSCTLYKTCDPRGGAIFGPRGIILKKLVEPLLDDAIYQISRPCSFKQEDFFMFLPI